MRRPVTRKLLLGGAILLVLLAVGTALWPATGSAPPAAVVVPPALTRPPIPTPAGCWTLVTWPLPAEPCRPLGPSKGGRMVVKRSTGVCAGMGGNGGLNRAWTARPCARRPRPATLIFGCWAIQMLRSIIGMAQVGRIFYLVPVD